MQERVSKLLPRSRTTVGEPKPERPTICTFHSLCVRILREHIEKLGYKRNFVIYDQSEQISTVKKILSQILRKSDKIEPGAVLSALSRLRTAGEATKLYSDLEVLAVAQAARARYESALRACNALDFDDLILLTLRLFREYPESLDACRAKYRYVMVDEYQDTNSSQFELVYSLTKDHRNFCVVGDDDQSIYGWRGAEVSNILEMEKHFPEVKVIKLEQNYRSTNTILSTANALIQKNINRRGKRLWSQNGEGSKIVIHCFKDDEEEAQTVVDLIEFNRLAHRVPWGEQAILFRTNAQSRSLEAALRQKRVRYHLIGGQSFFDRREIRDFLAYLKTFINCHDDVSLLRIANVPARGLSDVTMERVLGASQERKCSVFSAMKNPLVTTTFQSQARASIEAFVNFVERTGALLHSAPGTLHLNQWAERFLNETGYIDEIRRSERNLEAAENRIRNLKELVASMASAGDPSNTPFDRLQTFLEEVTLDTEREDEDEEPGDAVTLITMHSCKGLEFPHVFIVGIENGLLPHSRSIDEHTTDEERRLFYVALTRAMRTLTLSYCSGRKKYGQLLPAHPSPFLQELPNEYLEHADQKAKTAVNVQAGKGLFSAMLNAVE